MISRTLASVVPRQSPSSLILWSINAEADSAGRDFFMKAPSSEIFYLHWTKPAPGASGSRLQNKSMECARENPQVRQNRAELGYRRILFVKGGMVQETPPPFPKGKSGAP